ncbi:hypothetical protein DXG01_014132, partial [Tephrocybe rancida]
SSTVATAGQTMHDAPHLSPTQSTADERGWADERGGADEEVGDKAGSMDALSAFADPGRQIETSDTRRETIDVVFESTQQVRFELESEREAFPICP